MAVSCVLKHAATVSSYSSGGSGAIFAPALFMGAMQGGSGGYLDVIVAYTRAAYTYISSDHFTWIGEKSDDGKSWSDFMVVECHRTRE
jgi:hypothetical protein